MKGRGCLVPTVEEMKEGEIWESSFTLEFEGERKEASELLQFRVLKVGTFPEFGLGAKVEFLDDRIPEEHLVQTWPWTALEGAIKIADANIVGLDELAFGCLHGY